MFSKTQLQALILAIVAGTLGLAGCQGDLSREPPVHLNPNMDFQDKYKPQGSSDFFEDGRASRMPPKNTIPRPPGTLKFNQDAWGNLQTLNEFRELVETDRYLKTNIPLWCGKSEGAIENCGEEKGPWVTSIPISVLKPRQGAKNVEAEAFVRRGQNRYNIYCAPCHGVAGYGQGKVSIRSDYAIAPPNFHAAEYGLRAPGEIYHAITYGRGSMSHYRTQIPDPLDRWAIVNYVRALQYSQNYEANRVKVQKKEAPKPPAVLPKPTITNPIELERLRQQEKEQESGPMGGANAQPQGAPSQGAASQGAPSQGAPSQGAPSQGAPSQGQPSGGSASPNPQTGAQAPAALGASTDAVNPATPAAMPNTPMPAMPAVPATPSGAQAPAGGTAPSQPGIQPPSNTVTPAPAATGANETK